MNEKQKECFRMVYDFIHDESISTSNISSLIAMNFRREEGIGIELTETVKPYLDVRSNFGKEFMDILYEIKEKYKEELK